VWVLTSDSGTVSWGIYMYDTALDAGPWIVDVYVDGTRVDAKDQEYPPHGSLPPKIAPKGAYLRIGARHYAIANGEEYVNIPDRCEIP
jgi:hypothetical protein